MSLDAPSAAVVDASPFRVSIVAARYNAPLVDGLLASVVGGLVKAGVKKRSIVIERVPGSHELSVAALWLARARSPVRRPDAVIALGVLIRGGTLHYELIARTATDGLQRVALGTGVPVINGVIVAETARQAKERCLGSIARGAEFAAAAVEMAALRRRLSR